MKDYELSLDDFIYLARVVSRHHAKEIASWVGFTAHSRKGGYTIYAFFTPTKRNHQKID